MPIKRKPASPEASGLRRVGGWLLQLQDEPGVGVSFDGEAVAATGEPDRDRVDLEVVQVGVLADQLSDVVVDGDTLQSVLLGGFVHGIVRDDHADRGVGRARGVLAAQLGDASRQHLLKACVQDELSRVHTLGLRADLVERFLVQPPLLTQQVVAGRNFKHLLPPFGRSNTDSI